MKVNTDLRFKKDLVISLIVACTEKQAMDVISDLYSTDTVMSVLKRHAIDTKSFFTLIESVPSLTESYIRAHGVRADLFADMVIEESRSFGDPNAARNRMNALIWTASKMKPDKYGERLDVNVNQTVDIRGALDEAKNRIREISEIPKLHLVENTTAIPLTTGGLQPVETRSTVKTELDELLD